MHKTCKDIKLYIMIIHKAWESWYMMLRCNALKWYKVD